MKSTGNFDFNLEKARIFSSKARVTREDLNLTEQLTVVSVLIRIVWDSIRGAFNMLRSAVMRLHLNLGDTEFQAKQSVND